MLMAVMHCGNLSRVFDEYMYLPFFIPPSTFHLFLPCAPVIPPFFFYMYITVFNPFLITLFLSSLLPSTFFFGLALPLMAR